MNINEFTKLVGIKNDTTANSNRYPKPFARPLKNFIIYPFCNILTLMSDIRRGLLEA